MNDKTKGISMITLSAVLFGSYGIWSRIMGHSFGEFSQAWTRAILMLVIFVPLAIFWKQLRSIKRKDVKWFLIISTLGALNQAPYYYAFSNLSIGTATLLFYAALTVWTYILGMIFFKEKITAIKFISLVLAIVGIGTIFQFSLQPSQIMAALSAVLAGMMGGTFVTLSKKISGTYSPLQIILIDVVVMFVANLIIDIAFHTVLFPSFSDFPRWLAVLAYAGALIGANVAVIYGFKYVEPSVGALLGLTEILFAAVFGLLIFKDVLTASTLIGGLFILVAAALPNINLKRFL